MTRLKHIATVIAGQSPSSEDVFELASGKPFLQGNAEFGRRHPIPRYECEKPSKKCRVGDVLVSVRAPVGAVNVADADYGIGRGLCAVRPTDVDPEYLWWWLQHAGEELNATATGTTFAAVTAGDLGALPVLVVDRSDQHQIATFLARETAKIDTLILEQRGLVDVLRERRSALISQTVTKGLDRSVALVPSGFEWLGPVPEHWELKALRRLGASRSGAGFPVNLQGDSSQAFPFFKVRNLSLADERGFLRESEDTVDASTAASLGATIFQPGTLVYAKVGAALMLARIRILSTAGCLDNNMAGLTPRPGIDVRWLWYALALVRFDYLVNPGAVPSLSDKNLAAFVLAVPPVSEQRQISAFLDEETMKIDSLIVEAEGILDVAKERRAALISAAVMGQLDVRGEVA